MKTSPYQHAIVIGGSMTGMLTARVLSDHFEKVTLIERDRYPHEVQARSAVPQSRHLHVLLVAGMRIFETLFPGFDAELAAAGAPLMRWGQETCTLLPTGWLPEFASEFNSRTASRVLLDWMIYQRLQKTGKVEILEEHQALAPLTSADNSRILGLRVRTGKGTAQREFDLQADLVVDASGRTSPTPDWLLQMGYAAPQVSVVNSFLGYTTRWYKVPENLEQSWKILMIMSRPPHIKRGAALLITEGGRMVLTLGGAAGDHAPTEEAGFLEFARSLASPVIYEIIKDAEPLSPIYGYQRTQNQLRHYEKLTRLPEGLVVLGDAACAFNPLYGQGMTVGAQGAVALGDCLREARGDLTGLPQRFQKRLAKVVSGAWTLATSEDFRYAETEGDRSGLSMKFMHWYTDQVLQIMPKNDDVIQAFVQVMNLLKPPSSLLTPKIILKVLRYAAFGGKPIQPVAQPYQLNQTTNYIK